MKAPLYIQALHYIAEVCITTLFPRYIACLRRFLLGTSRSHIFLEFPPSDSSDGYRREVKGDKFFEKTAFQRKISKRCRYKSRCKNTLFKNQRRNKVSVGIKNNFIFLSLLSVTILKIIHVLLPVIEI